MYSYICELCRNDYIAKPLKQLLMCTASIFVLYIKDNETFNGHFLIFNIGTIGTGLFFTKITYNWPTHTVPQQTPYIGGADHLLKTP